MEKLQLGDESCLPSSKTASTSSSSGGDRKSQLQKAELNSFLEECDIEQLGRRWMDWHQVNERTQEQYIKRSSSPINYDWSGELQRNLTAHTLTHTVQIHNFTIYSMVERLRSQHMYAMCHICRLRRATRSLLRLHHQLTYTTEPTICRKNSQTLLWSGH